ncbi:MAG: hypothetical protein PHQ60_04305 [Sideroxydans sp.]|nr:hypothetical protein [Sideroxydans sp.]
MSSSYLYRTLLAAALLSAFSLNAFAAPGEVEMNSFAERETMTVKNGKKVMVRTPVDKAVPGDEIIYTTTFKNLTAKPAAHIVITNPVPNSSVYVANSATGNSTDITYSVDGGNNFAPAEKLIVKTKEGKTRLAQPAEYTHIRWTYKGDLGAGKSGEISFHAAIK